MKSEKRTKEILRFAQNDTERCKMKKYSIVIILLLITNYVLADTDIKAYVKEAKAIVAAGVRSTDERIRANAIESISGSSRMDMVKEIVALLNDPSPMVRFAAASALGDLNYVQAKDKLKEMTKDPDLNVAMASCYALCKMGEDSYYKKIEDTAGIKNQTYMANAAMLLGKLGKKEALPILYKIKDSPDSLNAAAFNATEAIARIGDERIYKKIWTMLISVYADDRYMGAHAMAAYGGSRGTNALITLLDDEIPEVRLTVAEQLAILGDNTGKVVVKEYFTAPALEDKNAVERCNAIAAIAIGQIADPEMYSHLAKLLKNESPIVQLAAAKSILMLDKAR